MFPAEGIVAGRPVFAFIGRAERTLLLYYAVASLSAVRSVADRRSQQRAALALSRSTAHAQARSRS